MVDYEMLVVGLLALPFSLKEMPPVVFAAGKEVIGEERYFIVSAEGSIPKMLLTDIPLVRKHIYENPTPWERSVWRFKVRWMEPHRRNAAKPLGCFS